MKEFIKFVGYFFIIISPLIFIFHLLFSMFNFEYIAQIDNENIEMMKYYLSINGIEVKEDLKEVKLYNGNGFGKRNYKLVYQNGEVKEFSLRTVQNSKARELTDYITSCSKKNDMVNLRIVLIAISTIASISTIRYLGKTEIIEEE